MYWNKCVFAVLHRPTYAIAKKTFGYTLIAKMYVVSLITVVAHYTPYEEKSNELIRTVDYSEDHDVPFTFFY